MINQQKLSAIFYALSSIFVIFINKSLLTQYHFPYFIFVATLQFIFTSIFLYILYLFKKVDIPILKYDIFIEILPLSILFLGNVVSGLGGTKSLNLPMFTALRRFSILMTMILESLLVYHNIPSYDIIISILLMIGGAIVASLYDLTYDTYGYILIFINNIFTALNGVYMKKTTISGKVQHESYLVILLIFSYIITKSHPFPNTSLGKIKGKVKKKLIPDFFVGWK